MEELKVFNYMGKQIRVIEREDSPWFVGKDVAEVLGYRDTSDALKKHVDEEDKGVGDLPTPGGAQKAITINESGLYSLIFASKLPSAQKFRRWVTSEVLPSIRKHGAYASKATIDKVIADPDFGIRLLSVLKEEQEKRKALENTVAIQTQQLAEAKPKIGYYDMVLNSPSLVKTSVIAKDYGMGAPSFNKLLARLKIQYKQGDIWIMYSRYQDKGYTQTETYHYENVHTGEPGTACWTKWTQKGRLFLYDTLKAEGILPVCERADMV